MARLLAEVALGESTRRPAGMVKVPIGQACGLLYTVPSRSPE